MEHVSPRTDHHDATLFVEHVKTHAAECFHGMVNVSAVRVEVEKGQSDAHTYPVGWTVCIEVKLLLTEIEVKTWSHHFHEAWRINIEFFCQGFGFHNDVDVLEPSDSVYIHTTHHIMMGCVYHCIPKSAAGLTNLLLRKGNPFSKQQILQLGNTKSALDIYYRKYAK